jgi:hypothetical protein
MPLQVRAMMSVLGVDDLQVAASPWSIPSQEAARSNIRSFTKRPPQQPATTPTTQHTHSLAFGDGRPNTLVYTAHRTLHAQQWCLG